MRPVQDQSKSLPLNKKEKAALYLVNFLKQHEYLQIDIVKKLKILGVKFGTANYNKLANLKKNKEKGRGVGQNTIKKVIPALETIIERELGFKFDTETCTFKDFKDYNWIPSEIKMPTHHEEPISCGNETKIHKEGKRPLSEKLKLLQKAQYKYIDLGLNLEDLIVALTYESEASFKQPLLEKLRNGLQVYFYVVNPQGRYYSLFLEDRAKAIHQERKTLKTFKETFNQLRRIVDDLNNQSRKGQIELNIYNTLPIYRATVIEPQQDNAKMMVSHFMYGLKIADCPVFEITKEYDKKLFCTYWESISHIIKQSKPVELIS